MKVYLHKVRVNKDGYTQQGYYFGAGKPLYRCMPDDYSPGFHVRAANRDEAKKEVLKFHPKAVFFR